MKTQLVIWLFYAIMVSFSPDLEKALASHRETLVSVSDKTLLAGYLRMEAETVCPAILLATYDHKGNYEEACTFTREQFLATLNKGKLIRPGYAYLIHTGSTVYFFDLRGGTKQARTSL